MSAILLIRHASCEGLGARLNGRADGVRLSPAGRAEAASLGERLARLPLKLVMSSPRVRCRETADAVAAPSGAKLEIAEDLDEVDFGAWTGRDFALLECDPAWRDWNERRSVARTPGGERMADVQARMKRVMAAAQRRMAGGAVALVSHAEPIRALLAEMLGFSLDGWARLEVSPAGVTRLETAPLRVCCINETLI